MKLFFYLLFIAVAPGLIAQDQSNQFELTSPKSTDSLVKLSIWATYYHVHTIESSGSIPFLDAEGKSMGFYADTCDFCKAALEGTGIILDKNGTSIVLNYLKKGDSCVVNCRLCPDFAKTKLAAETWGFASWTFSSGFGNGVKNYALVPYRTIAVDPTKIAYGSILYIPKADGISFQTPEGDTLIHDGYFFAGDTGGAIKEFHIDVFTGTQTQNPFVEFVFSDPKKPVEAYLITEPEICDYLKSLHSR